MLSLLLPLAFAVQAADQDLTELPPDADWLLASKCECPPELDPNPIILQGLVIDAMVTLAPGGLSVNERQATVFDVSSSTDKKFKGRTPVWHSNIPDNCGLTFNYGSKYKIAARKNEEGKLETDQCLMRQAR